MTGSEGIEEQSCDACNDRNIGQVEDVPIETGHMEGEKVGDRAIMQPVDGVAERAADDEADACGGKWSDLAQASALRARWAHRKQAASSF